MSDDRADAAATVLPRVWAALMACGFASLAVQVPTTFGRDGLLPLAASAGSEGLAFGPTLLALGSPDAVILGWLGVGFAAALAAAGGWRPAASWGVTLFVWWQVSMASPLALGLPPDFVMLHGGVAMALMDQARTRRAGVWLARALFFGLYFEAGLVKAMRGWVVGQEWMTGTGLESFFEVVTIPGLFAPTLAHLPSALLHAGTWAGMVGQLVVPWLVFGNRWSRLVAACWFALFQVLLIAGANFGLLLWGPLALCLVLVDDRFLPAGWGREALHDGLPAAVGRGAFGLLVGAWLVQGAIDTSGFGREGPLRRGLEGWRLSTLYGMFDSIPKRRVEGYFAVSYGDGAGSDLLVLPDQLDPVAARGRFLGPHHPRLPFFLWFHTTILEDTDWAQAVQAFSAPDGPRGRPVNVARYTAAWLCRTKRNPRTGLPPVAASWVVTEVGYAPPGASTLWQADTLGVSEPVPCVTLLARATHPYEDGPRQTAPVRPAQQQVRPTSGAPIRTGPDGTGPAELSPDGPR